MSSSPPPQKIELTEETEGERASVSDLVFFHAVGEPIRIKPEASAVGDNGGGSDSVDWLPTQPITVSEKHGLLFVSHSSGFCVAKTKDVMEVAKGKGSGDCYVTEMSVVNVDIENVLSLSLSRDSAVVAVCAGLEVRFFSVDLLLNKEKCSPGSSTIDESPFIKDFRWLKTTDNAFTILSGSGKLYNGSVGGPLKFIMDGWMQQEVALKGCTCGEGYETRDAGSCIQRLAKSVNKVESHAVDLMDDLREIPGREALKLRAEVASMASNLKQQRVTMEKRIVKISELGVAV